MHAILCQEHSGPEVMRYEEIPRPEPAAGERETVIGNNAVEKGFKVTPAK